MLVTVVFYNEYAGCSGVHNKYEETETSTFSGNKNIST